MSSRSQLVPKVVGRALTLGAALTAACSPEAVDPGAIITTVAIAPPSATVSVGATISLNAETRDARGAVLSGHRVTWSSEDTAIAEVTPSGTVTGRRVGSVLIAASAQGKDAVAMVTVNPTPVSSIRLSTTHRSMLVGESVLLTADPLDLAGGVLQGRPISWSSSNETVATVTQSGLVTAISPGGAVVSASAEGKTSVASITVSAVPVASVAVTPDTNNLVAGQTTQLTAQVSDANGAPLSGRVVEWSTSSASVATVTSVGLVTAISAGTATISATLEGRSGTATVNVSPRPVSAVIVSPGQVTIVVGQQTQLTTMVTDDRGLLLTGRPITFSTDNNLVASVSATGLVTAVAPGSATITAMSEGKTGTASVSILPEPVASVDIGPSAASVIIGQSLQLTATPRNASGQPLTGRTVIWTSGAPGLATVSTSGLVTGLVPGTAVVIATVDGTVGSAPVTVRDIPVASVTVTPATASTAPGQSIALTATLRDAGGNVLTGRVVTWVSSNTTIATVAGGVVTGVAIGTATITAGSEGQAGSATVTVAPVPVATVDVSPSSPTLFIGEDAQLVATPRSANGTVLTGRNVSWTSDNTGVATVSLSGLVTGVSAGTARITALIDGVQGFATATVSLVPVASLTVTPSTASMSVGQSVPLTAIPRDAANNVLTGRLITWTTSDPTIATVSSGVVTGVAAGSATITATSEGKSGSSSVTINPALAPVDSVVVAPSTVTLDIGNAQAITATTLDSVGNVLTGRIVTWTTFDASVASVDVNGLITAVAAGGTTVTATSEGQTATVTVTVVTPSSPSITVTPAAVTLNVAWSDTLTATFLDASGNPVPGASIVWSTSDASVANVSVTGVVTGMAPGSATITASSGGVTDSSSVTVQDAPVDHITLTPANPAIDPGQTVQLTATLYDLQNNVLTGRPITWASADSTKVSVDTNGLATGLKKGTVTITATSEGKSGATNVRVR